MASVRSNANLCERVSTYKKLPAKWGLPNRNWSSAQKDQELAKLSGADEEHVPINTAPAQRVPPNLLMRYQKQRQRRARTQISPQSINETPNGVSGLHVQTDSEDITDNAGSACPKTRELFLPDEMRSLEIIVHHIPEYCLRCLSSSYDSLGDEQEIFHSDLTSSLVETKSLPWNAYARYYNAFQLVKYGSMRQANAQMMEAALMVKQAMQVPTVRLLACLLFICFIVVTDTTQNYMKATLRYLANAASQNPATGTAHPLTRIMEAVASLSLSSAEAKVRAIKCLVNVMRKLSMQDFDAVYESWELLILMLKQTGDLVEAESQCHELIRLSKCRRGSLCDNTFRARRLLGRIVLQRGQIAQAEELFLELNREWNTYSKVFKKSPSCKEWEVWENLAHVSALRGDMVSAEQYLRVAHDSSSQRYGETDGNTIHILAELVKLLQGEDKVAELSMLEGKMSKGQGSG